MPALVMEMQRDGGWHHVGAVAPGAPPGSVSNNTPDGRQIIQFACHGDHSTIERSIGGVDTELAARTLRATASLGFEELARLSDGEVYEIDVQTDRMTRPARFRFRHEEQR